MTATPGSPYRSKFVSFAVERSHRFKRRVATAIRWAKMGLIGGVQWVLHPIYLLAQAERWQGRTLQAAAAPKLLNWGQSHHHSDTRLSNAALDASLQHILEVARIHVPLESIESDPPLIAAPGLGPAPKTTALAKAKGTALLERSDFVAVAATQRAAVRGLACQMSDRALVLVNDRNCALDCLTAVPQKFLRHQIERALTAHRSRKQQPLAPERSPQPAESESIQLNPLAALVRAAIAYFSQRRAATQLPSRDLPQTLPAKPSVAAIATDRTSSLPRSRQTPHLTAGASSNSDARSDSPPSLADALADIVVPTRVPDARVATAMALLDSPLQRLAAPQTDGAVRLQRAASSASVAVSVGHATIDTQSIAIGYDKSWHERILTRVDRAAYGVESAAESAGDRLEAVGHQVRTQFDRQWQGNRRWADRVLTLMWNVLMLAGAFVATFAEVVLPVVGRIVLQCLRWMAIAGRIAARGLVMLGGRGLLFALTELDRRL